jgi:hypothetical protein
LPETLTIAAPADEGAALREAVRMLDAGFADMPRTGAHTLAGMEAGEPAASAAVLLASLACGRRARIRALLRHAGAKQPGRHDPPDAAPLLPLLLPRYLAWTGDLHTAAAAWPATRESAARLLELPTPTEAVGRVLHAGAVAGLERAAADLGDAGLAARLHRASREAAAPAASFTPEARLLAAALDLPIDPPLDSAPAVAAPEPALDLRTAAFRALHAVHTLIGAAPDAFRNRLWLRPRLPAGVDCLRVESLLAGDGSFAMTVQRTARVVQVRIRQDAGAIPATALLEIVAPAAPLATRVDGAPASLQPRSAAEGWLVPVQLVLDNERTLEIDVDPGARE